MNPSRRDALALSLATLATGRIAGAEDPKFTLATFETELTIPLGHPCMGGGVAPAKEVLDPLLAHDDEDYRVDCLAMLKAIVAQMARYETRLAFRVPGKMVERLVEVGARELGIDPADLRKKNFIKAFPHQTPVIMCYDAGDYPKALDRALELADYANIGKRKAEAAS